MKMDPNVFKKTVISKLTINGAALYVKFIWNPNDDDLFHIKIFHDNVTWSGKFSNESAKYYCDRCEETLNEYIKNAMRYLEYVRNDVTYDFVIKEDNEQADFIWKKRFEGATLVHGSVLVNLDMSADSKDDLIDILLEENRKLSVQAEHWIGKNNIITTELKKYKTELVKFVDIKTELEANLYGKFVQVLNAKKRRIQVLEGSVHKFSEMNDLGGDH